MMLVDENTPVYLCRTPVDFRKQINGLSVLIEAELGVDPFAPCVYGFVNRAKNRVKLLYWDKNGYCMFLKRLEKHRFVWPSSLEDDLITLNAEHLSWLLGGYDVFRFAPHERIFYKAIS